MIHSGDLTTREVRTQYVLPLLTEILEKTSLIDNAARLGIETCPIAAAEAENRNATASGASSQSVIVSSDVGVSTLFQEIATDRASYAITVGDCADAGRSTATNKRCHAELLEEAAALTAYMTSHEHTFITAYSSSCLLSFLIPQCNSLGFLHSYFDLPLISSATTMFTSSKPTSIESPTLIPLEERLENAILSNHNYSSGGVFPYSAPRMRSLMDENDDGFTSSSFRRFLIQGLSAYLSTGRAFMSPPKVEESDTNDDDEVFSSYKTSLSAGADLIQLLAMAICPNPPNGEMTEQSPKSLSMDACKGAGDELHLQHISIHLHNNQLANSTLPFSFQLAYADRLEVVQLCAAKLIIPEREDGALDAGDAREYRKDGLHSNSGGTGSRKNNASHIFDVALPHLRKSLFGFASYMAHSSRDAMLAYKALTNIAIHGQNILTVQYDFQRLLRICMESTSSKLTLSLGETVANLITRYNESRYYADGEFTRFSIGVLAKSISKMIAQYLEEPTQETPREEINEEENNDHTRNSPGEEAHTKRQKRTESSEESLTTHTAYTGTLNHFRLVALLTMIRPIFYFSLDNDPSKKRDSVDESGVEVNKVTGVEMLTKAQLIRDVTMILSYASDVKVVQTAADMLAFALAYNEKYICETSNLKHLFRCTWKVLSTQRTSTEPAKLDDLVIFYALKKLLVTASRRSKTFAFNLLICAIKACSGGTQSTHFFYTTMVWKIASMVAYVHPSIVSNKLADLDRIYSGAAILSEEDAINRINTHLSCALSSLKHHTSADTIQRCGSLAEHVTNHWDLFRIVRHAFATSNFGFARLILDQRLRKCSRQQSFLWLKNLSKIADAEEMLIVNGAEGISQALEKLSCSYSSIISLAKIEQSSSFDFQTRIVRIRLDFVHVCMVTRALCAEILLLGGSVPGGTRTRTIRKNLPKMFRMLASRYTQIHQLYGLHYCEQTRSSVRTLCAMCLFMGDFVEQTMSESSSNTSNSKSLADTEQDQIKPSHPKGDKNHPMGSLLMRLRAGALEKNNKCKPSTSLHANELLDAIDAILRCPAPFPLGMFNHKLVPYASVNISTDPKLTSAGRGISSDDDYVTTDDSGAEIIDILPGSSLMIVCSGVIPKEFIESADLDFFQIIAWRTVCYEGRLFDDEDAEDARASGDDEEFPSSPLLIGSSDEPFSTTLLPDGKFILPIDCDPVGREGHYRVKVTLGCRDVRCGEWYIPTKDRTELVFCVKNPW